MSTAERTRRRPLTRLEIEAILEAVYDAIAGELFADIDDDDARDRRAEALNRGVAKLKARRDTLRAKAEGR
jgi:hypothetical protein